MKTGIGRLRLLGYTEGLSLLLLLGVAMPLKYMMDMPKPVTWVGSAHGALWIVYVLALMFMYLDKGWSVKLLVGGIVASVLPFGPFVFDRFLPEHDRSTSSRAS